MRGLIFCTIILFSYVYAFKALKQDRQRTLNLQEQEVIKNAGVSLRIYGAPWTVRFSALLHSNEDMGDTLFLFKCQQIDDKDTCEIKKIYLNKAALDTFYAHVIAIKKNFRLNNHDSGIQDGTNVNLIIGASANNINMGYRALPDARSANVNVTNLIDFINKKLPEDFQLF